LRSAQETGHQLDGSHHLEQQEYDEERTKYLEARGYRVLRFWNKDVMNTLHALDEAARK
jgi:very-short-patch-repair endonuclease